MSNINCKTCALYIKTQQGCAHWQKHTQESDSCSYWTDSVPTCAMCGRSYMGPTYWLEGCNVWQGLCGECAHSLGTCATCKSGTFCAFRQDQSIRLPLMVQQQVRQGNAVMVTQIKNPERVKLTCEKCACYTKGVTDDECGCNCEEFHTCGNYQIKEIITNG